MMMMIGSAVGWGRFSRDGVFVRRSLCAPFSLCYEDYFFAKVEISAMGRLFRSVSRQGRRFYLCSVGSGKFENVPYARVYYTI